MGLLSALVKKQKVISLPSSASVFDASQKMAGNKIGSIVVIDKETISGIFTERDLLNRVIAKGLDPQKISLAQVMSKQVATIPINETVEEAYKKMETTKCRRLPIMDGNKVAGMVTMRNILEWITSEMKEENIQLKKYIQS